MDNRAFRSFEEQDRELRKKLAELRARAARERAPRIGATDGDADTTPDPYSGFSPQPVAPPAPSAFEQSRIASLIDKLDELSFEHANSRLNSHLFDSQQSQWPPSAPPANNAAAPAPDNAPSTPDAAELAAFRAALASAFSL